MTSLSEGCLGSEGGDTRLAWAGESVGGRKQPALSSVAVREGKGSGRAAAGQQLEGGMRLREGGFIYRAGSPRRPEGGIHSPDEGRGLRTGTHLAGVSGRGLRKAESTQDVAAVAESLL